MRRIVKRPDPDCLCGQDLRQPWNEFMGTPCHEDVRRSLRHEQYHLCGYCESSIAGERRSMIEHMVPRSVAPERIYDYANLIASCDSGTVPHCGKYKDQVRESRFDERSFASPHGCGNDRLYRYNAEGRVTPAPDLSMQDHARADYMIRYLNLNCSKLVERRKRHFRQLEQMRRGIPLAEWRRFIERHYLSPDDSGNLREFQSVTLAVLAS